MKKKTPVVRNVSFPTSKNLLKDTRCYLIGHMQYANGEGWRNEVKKQFEGRGIKFYDPYHQPFIEDVPENDESRKEMLHWMETEQFDLVHARMKKIRGYDLRNCDLCDWFIAVIKPDVASWGSAEEITTLLEEQKPLFLVIDHPKGKKACPLWIMAMVSHKHIYNNLQEVINTAKAIDDGVIKMTSDRWKLYRPELR